MYASHMHMLYVDIFFVFFLSESYYCLSGFVLVIRPRFYFLEEILLSFFSLLIQNCEKYTSGSNVGLISEEAKSTPTIRHV